MGPLETSSLLGYFPHLGWYIVSVMNLTGSFVGLLTVSCCFLLAQQQDQLSYVKKSYTPSMFRPLPIILFLNSTENVSS